MLPMRSERGRVLALVLAGGEGGRLDVLTAERTKPAMPFAGVYRLIDFPLSNLHHSQLSDVWVLQQYEPHSLTEHLANGRPWDLDRTRGGLRVVHPYLGDAESGWYEGNADAIHSHRSEIEAFDPELLLVLSADHVYTLDYAEVIERHRATAADVTVVTTRVPREQASRFGVVEVDGDGLLTGFEYKPEEPRSELVTTEVFVYGAKRLLALLEELAGAEGDDQSGLADFGHELLPRLVEEGKAYEFRHEGYWRDVGTIESYWQGHMDLLGSEPALDLDDPSWPVLTLVTPRPPARIEATARIDGSLVGPGARVAGEVTRSVLGPGVTVAAGAAVRDSVLLHDVVVAPGATVECAILDAHARVGKDAVVGAPGGSSEEEIAVVGHDVEISDGARIDPGARIEARGAHDTSSPHS